MARDPSWDAMKCLLWAGLHGLVQLRGVRGSAKARIYMLLLIGTIDGDWLPTFGWHDFRYRGLLSSLYLVYLNRLAGLFESTFEARFWLWCFIPVQYFMFGALGVFDQSPFQPTFEQNMNILRTLDLCAFLAALLIGLSAAARM